MHVVRLCRLCVAPWACSLDRVLAQCCLQIVDGIRTVRSALVQLGSREPPSPGRSWPLPASTRQAT